jgi:hypothetical protein
MELITFTMENLLQLCTYVGMYLRKLYVYVVTSMEVSKLSHYFILFRNRSMYVCNWIQTLRQVQKYLCWYKNHKHRKLKYELQCLL